MKLYILALTSLQFGERVNYFIGSLSNGDNTAGIYNIRFQS